MNKIYRTFIILILSTLLFSCIDTSTQEPRNNNARYHMFVENVRGHDYIIVTVNSYGGASIIHAESCKCKQ